MDPARALAALLMVALGSACASPTAEAVRAEYCDVIMYPACGSAECRPALEARDWCDGEGARVGALQRSEFEDCVTRCPLVEVCPAGSFPGSFGYDCDCFGECVAREPEVYQRALLDFITCSDPEECEP